METDEKRAVVALQKIDEILSEFRSLFPKKDNGKEVESRVKTKGEPPNPFRILKRVDGIIKNFTEENSLRKVENLIKFMDAIKHLKFYAEDKESDSA